MAGNSHASLLERLQEIKFVPASLLLFMEDKMKRLLLFVTVLFLLLITACSEKDNPTDTNIYGVKLDQFISKIAVRDLVDVTQPDSIDYRNLFAYEIVSGDPDAWSPRLSVNAGYDLNWELFKEGFLVPSDNRKTWFPASLGLPSAFKVKNTGTVRLYRKVDVESGRGSTTVELKGLDIHSVQNWNSTDEDAIKLSDLLQGVTQADSIGFVAWDGYTKTYNWDQVNDGYYLLNSEVTTFPTYNATMPNSLKKFKKLARVIAYGSNAQSFAFDLAPNTATNLSVTVPTDLSGYQSTIMTDY